MVRKKMPSKTITRIILCVDIVFFLLYNTAGVMITVLFCTTTHVEDTMFKPDSKEMWEWESLKKEYHFWIWFAFFAVFFLIGDAVLGYLIIILSQGRRRRDTEKLRKWWTWHFIYAGVGHLIIVIGAIVKTKFIFYEIPFALFLCYRMWSIVKVWMYIQEIISEDGGTDVHPFYRNK